jgi:hypothetical protein
MHRPIAGSIICIVSIELEFAPLDDDALRDFLRDQITRGRAFLAGECALAPSTPCVLRLTVADTEILLAAEVVFVHNEDPGRGVGLQLAPLSAEASRVIDAFLNPRDANESEAPETVPSSPVSEEREIQALHVRMRGLTGVEQRRYAATGNLGERVLLERLYGPSVWEPLLTSLRLTLPEVATIARKGTVPRPLIDLIASNNAWLASGEVQRALLANPRSSTMVIAKVLRMLPKHDLARVPIQTAYPASVRQAAKEILGRGR